MLNEIANLKKGIANINDVQSFIAEFEKEYNQYLKDKRTLEDLKNTKEDLVLQIKNLEDKRVVILADTQIEIANIKSKFDISNSNTSRILKQEEARILALQAEVNEKFIVTEKLAEEVRKDKSLASEDLRKNIELLAEIATKNSELSTLLNENQRAVDSFQSEKISINNMRNDALALVARNSKEKEEFDNHHNKVIANITVIQKETNEKAANAKDLLESIKKENDKTAKLIGGLEEKKNELKTLEAKIDKKKKDLDDKERAINEKK